MIREVTVVFQTNRKCLDYEVRFLCPDMEYVQTFVSSLFHIMSKTIQSIMEHQAG